MWSKVTRHENHINFLEIEIIECESHSSYKLSVIYPGWNDSSVRKADLKKSKSPHSKEQLSSSFPTKADEEERVSADFSFQFRDPLASGERIYFSVLYLLTYFIRFFFFTGFSIFIF